MTEISDIVKKELPPGVYETLIEYIPVAKFDKDDLLQEILAKMKFNTDIPNFGMGGALANTVPMYQMKGNLSQTFGDDNKKLEYMLHEYLHNVHPEKSELAIRAETAKLLHNYGAELGSHSNYLR